MVSFVYQIRNCINGKLYIGKTNDLTIRWDRYRRLATNCLTDQAIHAAIRKYSIENFEFSVLVSCETDDRAFQLEKQIIAERNSIAPNGYNLNEGGKGGSNPTIEVRQKISSALTGKKHSAERRKRQSERMVGENNPMWKRKCSDGTKVKLSAASRGRKFSDEVKKKMSEQRKGRVPWNKGKKGVYSEETLKKISNASRKRIPWNKGKSKNDKA